MSIEAPSQPQSDSTGENTRDSELESDEEVWEWDGTSWLKVSPMPRAQPG